MWKIHRHVYVQGCTLIDLVNGPYPVTDDQLTASSEYGSFYGPRRARLHTLRDYDFGAGGWWAGYIDNEFNQYIQV